MKRTVVTTTIFVGLVGPAILAACAKDSAPAPSSSTSEPVSAAVVQPEAMPAAKLVTSRDLVPAQNAQMRLVQRGDHFAATAKRREDKLGANVDLPKDARGAFRVTRNLPAGNFALSVEALEATAAAGVDRDGIVRYPNAYGPGTELAQVATTQGTEDYVRLDQDSRHDLSYRVNLTSDVAGLRLVSNSLEFLDAEGTPHLRVASPYGVDATGKRFDAKLTLEGCAADTNPAAPWGRSVTAPGAQSCTVRVSWQSEGLNFPIAVDPAWTTTLDMSANNITWEMPLVVLSGGKILAVPGATVAQIFDPATNSWAATGAAPINFNHRSRLVAVAGNQAWGTGGYGDGFANNMQKTARYDLGTGNWTPTADTPNGSTAYDGKTITYVGNNKVILIDSSGTVHEYDVAANTYTAKTSSLKAHGYNMGAWLVNGEIWVQSGGVNEPRKYNVANDAWKTDYASGVFAPNSNTGQMEYLSNGKFLIWGRGNYASIWNPADDTVSAASFPAASSDVGHLCFRSPSITFGGGKKHLIGAGRYVYDEANNTITDNGASSVQVHGAAVPLGDGRTLAVGMSNIYGQSPKADIWGPSAQADCDGDFADPLKPVYSATSNTCVACANDNGGADPACPTTTNPACLTAGNNKGACVECAAGKLAACSTATKPACDTVANKCAGATGDFGTANTIACPTAANPFAKADGSCGKCTSNADCAGATPVHGGAICNTTTGACGTTCTADIDCPAGKFCDTVGTKTCIAKKADGAACGRKEECTSAVCTAGKCGVPTVADAGPDSGGKTDGGTTSSGGSDSGTTSSSGGSDSGTTSSSSGSAAPADSGGCGCKTSSDPMSNVGNFSVAGLVIGALAFMRRRRRAA